LIRHLRLKEPPVSLGNSLGGVNAYQFSARYHDLVRAMIIEDIGVEVSGDFNFCQSWESIFNPEDLEESFHQTKEGKKYISVSKTYSPPQCSIDFFKFIHYT
jgi:pimeloyl-ACP methyl ester carboxylesterase